MPRSPKSVPRKRTRRLSLEDIAVESLGKTDPEGFELRYINSFIGCGVFAEEDFPVWSFLLEYNGEFIDGHEGEERFNHASESFLFFCNHGGKTICIDATESQGLGRMVNHSRRDFNCRMRQIIHDGRPHLCVFATRQICANEQLLYNYGVPARELPWVKDPAIAMYLKPEGVPVHHYNPTPHACLLETCRFTIKPSNREPVKLKCSFSGSNLLQVGEELPSDINIVVLDMDGNDLGKFDEEAVKNLTITGVGLIDKDVVKALGDVSGFRLCCIKFAMTNRLGYRKLCIQWNNLREFVQVEICAGHPRKLRIIGWDKYQVLTLLSGSEIPQPLIVQLLDEAENTCTLPNILLELHKDKSVGLSPAADTVMTDPNGQATFGKFIVSAERGLHVLQPRAFLQNYSLSGPKFLVEIVDSTAQSLHQHFDQLDWDSSARCVADKHISDELSDEESNHSSSYCPETDQSLDCCSESKSVADKHASDEMSDEVSYHSSSYCPETDQSLGCCNESSSDSDTEASDYCKELKENPSQHIWRELAEVTLAQITLFNRRRGGEMELVTLLDYSRGISNSESQEEIMCSLSPLEVELLKSMSRIEVRGKRGRKVPILLTERHKSQINLLNKNREHGSISPDNNYMFPRPGESKTPIRSSYVLKKFALALKAEKPQFLTSTSLRKHIAVVTQLLNLKDNELDVVARFMGHDVNIHRVFYRLPDNTLELAKVSKLLLGMEMGKIAEWKGKSLDAIEVAAEDDVSDVSDDGDESSSSTRMDGEDSSEEEEEERAQNIDLAQKQAPVSCVTHRQPSIRRPWTKAEQAAVCEHLGTFINMHRCPGKKEIETAKKDQRLDKRSWKAINILSNTK